MKTPEQVANHLTKERATWLEDVIAGLLINGVREDEIEIQEHLDELKTVVAVRGVQKYSWTFSAALK